MTADAALQDQAPNRSKDSDCLFCRFDDQRVNKIFAESDNFYARRDNFPAAEGHLEIVPKRHVESFFALTYEEIAEAYRLMTEVWRQLSKMYQPEGYTIGVNEGRAAGRSVDHLHIHLIPRHFGDVEDPRGGIRQILPNCDPGLWTAD